MNFSLRPWNIDDLESLVKYANNPNIAKNLTDKFPHPYTEEVGRSFITFATSRNPVHILAIDIEGEVVGASGIHQQEDIMCKNAEMGYWLAEPFWGKGIVTEVVKQMVEYGFANFDIDRIYARPFGSNIGSQRVLEKAGFTLEARLEKTLYKWGRYEDDLIYAVRRNK
ncbi:MAG: GNAT family N-acetyltransferase [Bacteroidia bacterium]|nr:GNAT family N-acetyltransferase [Bacteroidia bacterium]